MFLVFGPSLHGSIQKLQEGLDPLGKVLFEASSVLTILQPQSSQTDIFHSSVREVLLVLLLLPAERLLFEVYFHECI